MKINNLITKLILLFAFTTSSWALTYGVTPSTVTQGEQYSVYANLDTIPKGSTQDVRVSFGTKKDKDGNIIWSTTGTKLDGSGLAWSKDFTAVSLGINYIRFSIYRDDILNSTIGVKSLTVIDNPPTLTITTPGNSQTNNPKSENFTLSYSASDDVELIYIVYNIYNSNDEPIFMEDRDLSEKNETGSFTIDIEDLLVDSYKIEVKVLSSSSQFSLQNYYFQKVKSFAFFTITTPGSNETDNSKIQNFALNVDASTSNGFVDIYYQIYDSNNNAIYDSGSTTINMQRNYNESFLINIENLPVGSYKVHFVLSEYVNAPTSYLIALKRDYYFQKIQDTPPTLTILTPGSSETNNLKTENFYLDINASDNIGLEGNIVFRTLNSNNELVQNIGYIGMGGETQYIGGLSIVVDNLPTGSYKTEVTATDIYNQNSKQYYHFQKFNNPPTLEIITPGSSETDNPKKENFYLDFEVNNYLEVIDIKYLIYDSYDNQIYDNGSLLTPMQNNRWSFLINIENLIIGSYRIELISEQTNASTSSINRLTRTYYFQRAPDNPPTITFLTPGSGNNNPKIENFTLDINASDDVGLTAIYYNIWHSNNSFTGLGGNINLSGKNKIVTLLMDIKDLPVDSYRIDFELVDTKNQSTPLTYYFQKPEIKEFSVNLESGWNMVAIPAIKTIAISELNNPDIEVIRTFKDEKWHVWTKIYIPTTDEELTSLQNGDGYWIKATNATTINISGPDILEFSTTTIQTNGKWHMAGSAQIDNFSEFFANNPSVTTVWKHSQNQWFAISRDAVIQQDMQDASINPFGSITPSEGFMYK